MMYLQVNLLELSKTCLERCLEIVDANKEYISHAREQQVAHMTLDALVGLGKVAWLEQDHPSLLRSFEEIGQLEVDKERIEYVATVEYNAALAYLNQNEVNIAISILNNALDMLFRYDEASYSLTSKLLRLLAYAYLCKGEWTQFDKCIEQAEKLCHSPVGICLKIRYLCEYDDENEAQLERLLHQLCSDSEVQIHDLDHVLYLLRRKNNTKKFLPHLLQVYKAMQERCTDSVQQLHLALKVTEIDLVLENQVAAVISELCHQSIEILSSYQNAYDSIGNLWKQFLQTLAFHMSTIAEPENVKQVAEAIIPVLDAMEPLLQSIKDAFPAISSSILSSSLILVYSGIVSMSLIGVFSSTSNEEEQQIWRKHTQKFTEKLLEWEPDSLVGRLSWICLTGNIPTTTTCCNPIYSQYFHQMAACILRSCCENRCDSGNSIATLVKMLAFYCDQYLESTVEETAMQRLILLSFLLVIACLEWKEEWSQIGNLDDWIPLSQIGMHFWNARNRILKDMEQASDSSLLWDSFLRVAFQLGRALYKEQRYRDALSFFKCFRIIATEKDGDNAVVILQSSLMEWMCWLTITCEESDWVYEEDATLRMQQINDQIQVCRNRMLHREGNKYECAYLLAKACYLVRTNKARELEQLMHDAAKLNYPKFHDMLANIQRLLT